MKKILYCGFMVLVLTSVSFAESAWTDGDSANSDWGNPFNWSSGSSNAPPASSDSTFVRYNDLVPGGQGPLINAQTTAVCRRLSLEASESGETVTMTMTGGTLDIYYAGVSNVYFRLGAGSAPGAVVLNMSGGTLTVDVDSGQYSPGANGYVRVGSGYTGQLNMSGDAVVEALDLIILDTSPDTHVDLRDDAKVILDGDDTEDIQGFIDDGLLTAYSGDGMIAYDYDLTTPGHTTVRAISHNLDPSPAYGANVATGDVLLSWTNFDPNIPGDPVYVDVWFGTDPNKPDATYTKVLSLAEDSNSVLVSAPVEGTYYWQVDSYIDGTTNPEAMIEGPVFIFNALDDFPPTVDVGPDMITWANQSIQLDAGLNDDGVSDVTILWEADDPNAVFSDPAIENPTVTVDYPSGAVGLTVTVQDENNPPVSDGLTIYVYEDACEAARVGAGLAAENPEDITVDCLVKLDDLAAIAAKWLANYALTEPIPVP